MASMIIKNHQLGTINEIAPANEFPTIGSDGIYRCLTTLGQFTVKFMKDPHKLAERLAYHQKSAPYLLVPKLLAHGEGYMVFEYLNGATLFRMVKSNVPEKNAMIELAQRALRDCWLASHGAAKQKRNCQELARAIPVLQNFLGASWLTKPVINGINSPYSFADMAEETLDCLQKLWVECLTHGDSHLDNVLIVDGNPSPKAAFIDLRPGLHWIDDLVVLGLWPQGFNFISFNQEPTVEYQNKKLEINYSPSQPSLNEESVMQFCCETALILRCYNWRPIYFYIKTANYLCEAAAVLKRQQQGLLEKELPRNIYHFWIAEALLNFRETQKST